MLSETNRFLNQAGWVRRGAVMALAVAGVVQTAEAIDITRSATAGTLNLPASWDGGVVPANADVAVWDTTSATSGQIGADTSWLGIKILGPAAGVSINGANVLTIGGSGIDMSAATQNLTLQPGATTTPATGIALGAAQIWNIGTARTLTAGSSSSAITGDATATLSKNGAGTLLFNTGNNTFAGGVTLNAGVITFNANSVVGTGGSITNGPLGAGTLTINGGTLSTSTTSGRDIANNVVVNSDFTIGNAGTARVRSAGAWDLGGQTRTVTLTNFGTGISNNSEQFGFIGQGTAPNNRIFSLLNGNLRFVGGPNTTAATPALINFAQGSGGVSFAGNSGLTIGNNVLAFEGSSQTNGGANSPKLTIEAGGVLLMSNNGQTKSFTAYSLSGAGIVASGQTDNTTSASTFTIDGTAGTSTFSGTIQNVYNGAYNTAYAGVNVSVNKTGGSTQILSNTNTYTGATTVSAGTLQLNAAQAVPQASATTVSGTGTLKLGTTAQTTLDSLTISGTGKVDLGQGKLLLNNGGGATALANFGALVATGRAGGTGFFSSAAVAGISDIGFKDTGTGIYARYTLLGDAELDGDVDFNDFLVLQNNFGSTDTRFDQANFNYDTVTDFNDFLALQNNFGQSVSGDTVAFTAEQVAAITAFGVANAVPEPASLAVLGLGAAAVLRRRRNG